MRFIFNPYKNGSRSVEALCEYARSVGDSSRELLVENSRYVHREDHIAINWGRSSLANNPQFGRHGDKVINRSGNVAICANKLKFFRIMTQAHGIKPRIPSHTTDIEAARSWQREGKHVCERHKLDGHSAEGLVIKAPDQALAVAPLYTMYVKKKDEYRIHYYRTGNQTRTIFVQKKVHPNAQRNGQEDIDWKIRNHAGGFIFQRNNIVVPDDVYIQSSRAFQASGLDIGAVDVIYNQASDKAYVLEINTAPGLEGESVKEYFDAIKKIGMHKHGLLEVE